jgi:cytosine/adenosine deaminase-related metal-dependent hydrolase
MVGPDPWTLTARWVFPADRPPLPRGVVTIQGGKILAVEQAGPRAADIDLGNVAILPGLVNAHTHLDLSDARGKISPTPDFISWLRKVIEHRRAQRPWEARLNTQAGLNESLRHGVTLVGDISTDGASWDLLAHASVRAVVFREMLGLSCGRAEETLTETNDWLTQHAATPTCIPGTSPHAPYSAHASLFFAASNTGAPVAVHLLETRDELTLLNLRAGPFVDFLRDLGVWDPSGLAQDASHVLGLLNGLSPTLLVHANFLSSDTAIATNTTIVYCPRTHAAFGHPPHPFREFMKRGVRVVLGTDSLASNPDLDILAEARFVARRHPDLPGETLLRMITLDAAEALGWAEVAGSLTPGKSADLVVLPVTDRDDIDPHRWIFDSMLPVERVMFRGQWVSGI